MLYGEAKIHPVKASHHQLIPKAADTTRIGPRTISDKINKAILTDLLAIHGYSFLMFEEENSRLKRLLVATVILYIVSWCSAYVLDKFLYDFRYIGLFIENQWVTYLLLFFGFAWMPATIFLFIQARNLNRKIGKPEQVIDKSVITLSLTLPIAMAIVYVGTRILYR